MFINDFSVLICTPDVIPTHGILVVDITRIEFNYYLSIRNCKDKTLNFALKGEKQSGNYLY
jgi:hypothetical protein